MEFYHHSPIPVVQLSSDGLILRCNPKACEILGLEHHYWTYGSHSLMDRLVLDSRKKLTDQIQEVISSKVAANFNIRFKVGIAFAYAHINLFQMRFTPTETTPIVAFMTPIKAPPPNHNLLHKLQLAVEQSPCSIIITDDVGNIEYANAKCLSISGYTKDEVIGMTPAIFNSGKQTREFYNHMWATITSGQRWSGIFCNRKKNGELYWEKNHISPIINSEGTVTHYIAIKEDLSELKKAEELNVVLKQKLEHKEKMEHLGLITAGIAHDFNNLLTTILGNIEYAMSSLKQETEIYQSLDQAMSEGMRAADLCASMLAYSGKGIYRPELFALKHLLNNMEPIIKSIVPAHISFTHKYDSHVPAVLCDAQQVRQMIVNMITNSVEAIEESGGAIEIRLFRQYCNVEYLAGCLLEDDHPAGEYVTLEVMDSGTGIRPENIKKIFDPFFSTKFIGRGLGLAAVLGWMQQHKGFIKVESRLDVGTNIKLHFSIPEALEAS